MQNNSSLSSFLDNEITRLTAYIKSFEKPIFNSSDDFFEKQQEKLSNELDLLLIEYQNKFNKKDSILHNNISKFMKTSFNSKE